MKKLIFALTLIIVLSLSGLGSQASAYVIPLHIEDFGYTIREEAPEPSIHVVEFGDTLWAIADDNNVSVDELLTWNSLESNLIYPSQEILIENKEVTDVEKEVEKEIVTSRETYVVEKGDTLFEIAENHNISLKNLIAWNEKSNDLIHPGDQLILRGIDSSSSQTTLKSTSNKVNTQTQAPRVATAPTSSTLREMTVTATAYTAYCKGCSGTTYTGIDLRSDPNQKVIAVDPSVIPLGSRVWVEGYGEAIAGDIGGAIKGNIIDVFLEHKQDALNWGRKKVTIKILE